MQYIRPEIKIGYGVLLFTIPELGLVPKHFVLFLYVSATLWCQLEDMFQLIGTSKCIERVLFQIIVTPEYFEKYTVKYKA